MSRSIERKNAGCFSKKVYFLPLVLLLAGCTFDYGDDGVTRGRPDIVMENILYIRVRGGDPIVRFHAEYAERWEDYQIMELQNFLFEQLEDDGRTVNAEGSANTATVELSSGDVRLKGDVLIDIEAEDLIIRAAELQWRDGERSFTGNEDEEVEIERSDGTYMVGTGFSANVRSRTWAFSGGGAGSFVED